MDGTIGTNGYVANEMYDRINYGRGGSGLAYGNSVLAADAHADGTAVKTAIDCNAASSAASLDRISAQNLETRTVLKMDAVIGGQIDAEFRNSDRLAGISKSMTDTEFRSIDRQRDIERLLVQNAKDAALCCCDAKLEAQKNASETQKLIINEGNETRALILAVEGRANLDKLSESRAENTYLKTIAALDHGHHPRP